MKPPFPRTRVLPSDSAWLATEPAPLGVDSGASEPVPLNGPATATPLHPLQPLHPLRRRASAAGRGGGAAMASRPGPFDALLDGLDIQELDSQTLFDRFFGPQPTPPER